MAHINLQKIVSVKGEAGLFHLVNYNPKGYFLQPLQGGATKFISYEKGRVLAIGNVDLKLIEGSINALDVFIKLNEESKLLANVSSNEIISSFNKLFPTLDSTVAPSHIQKIYKWYQVISDHLYTSELVNDEDDGLTIV